MGISLGVALLYGLRVLVQPVIASLLGFYLPMQSMTTYELALLAMIFLAGVFIGFVPGLKIYRQSLADGMMVRI